MKMLQPFYECIHFLSFCIFTGMHQKHHSWETNLLVILILSLNSSIQIQDFGRSLIKWGMRNRWWILQETIVEKKELMVVDEQSVLYILYTEKVIPRLK